MKQNIIKLFLRLAISSSFLSAVADRLGLWLQKISVWGNWQSFLDYTQLINPLIPKSIIPFLGLTATILEIVFAVCLLIGFKTELFAKLSGSLLLLFALAMCFSTGIKGAFDYSVLSAAAAAFALSAMKEKHYEIDTILNKV
ncbi:DoxX family protein [Flavivirga sp. 57AJ16]|uniref:DoxX family protein n=1 Tax=Flavivirga sp. 57AJ16 TaxID=3025307 RepID=UPI002365513C|nr:DoxX family protein [Flavivirga sp. 57AJ16]MDD7887072.1 DoxX family protein [Flavivirga sp. 57AJ16]